jgi:hypothetical protein
VTGEEEIEVTNSRAISAAVAVIGATGAEAAKSMATEDRIIACWVTASRTRGDEGVEGAVTEGAVTEGALMDDKEISGEVIETTVETGCDDVTNICGKLECVEMVTGRDVRTGLSEAAAGNLESANFGKPMKFRNLEIQAETIDHRWTPSSGEQFDSGGATIRRLIRVQRVMAHHGSRDLQHQMQRRKKANLGACKNFWLAARTREKDKSELETLRTVGERQSCNSRRITVRTADCWDKKNLTSPETDGCGSIPFLFLD